MNSALPGPGIHDVPAHVRDHRGVQPGDGSRPLPAARRLDPEFDAAGEQDLHADTDPQHRASGGHPLGDDPISPRLLRRPVMHASNAPTPGHHQPVGGRRGVGVGGHLDRRPDPLQRALRRP